MMTVVRCLCIVIFFAVFVTTKYVPEDDPDHPDIERSPTYKTDNPLELNANFWLEKSQNALKNKVEKKLNTNIAKNIIFFLGDGLSVPTLAAARAYLGQSEGATGEETEMSFEKFPAVGLSKTYCVDNQVADSACTATAYLTGVKANYGTIGVTASVPRYDCPSSQIPDNKVTSIAEWAIQSGKDAGIVTTTRITHASPAGAYAKTANRNWETNSAVESSGADPDVCADIAKQLIYENPGNLFKVILGGGRRNFLNVTVVDEEGDSGTRSDGLNLIDEWKADKVVKAATHSYVWNREQLINLDVENTDYVLGLFESNHLMYHMRTNSETEPTLTEMTEIAIKMLKKNENGFFVFIEAGRIDHAHHANRAQVALNETVELHKAVEKALELTNPEDTLIVLTADHAHVMAYNGYSVRGKDITGPNDKYGTDEVTYMTLSYTNGPGFTAHAEVGVRTDPLSSGLTGAYYRNPAEVPLGSETHGGDDVAVFAYGPYEHLFNGLYEQNDIPHIMAYAACIGDNLQACTTESSGTTASLSLFLTLSIFLFVLA